jgi:hypothetical protein
MSSPIANLQGARIAVGGFLRQTDTFQPRRTTYADFAEAGDRTPLTRGLVKGLERFSDVNTSIAGALAVDRTFRSSQARTCTSARVELA